MHNNASDDDYRETLVLVLSNAMPSLPSMAPNDVMRISFDCDSQELRTELIPYIDMFQP